MVAADPGASLANYRTEDDHEDEADHDGAANQNIEGDNAEEADHG